MPPNPRRSRGGRDDDDDTDDDDADDDEKKKVAARRRRRLPPRPRRTSIDDFEVEYRPDSNRKDGDRDRRRRRRRGASSDRAAPPAKKDGKKRSARDDADLERERRKRRERTDRERERERTSSKKKDERRKKRMDDDDDDDDEGSRERRASRRAGEAGKSSSSSPPSSNNNKERPMRRGSRDDLALLEIAREELRRRHETDALKNGKGRVHSSATKMRSSGLEDLRCAPPRLPPRLRSAAAANSDTDSNPRPDNNRRGGGGGSDADRGSSNIIGSSSALGSDHSGSNRNLVGGGRRQKGSDRGSGRGGSPPPAHTGNERGFDADKRPLSRDYPKRLSQGSSKSGGSAARFKPMPIKGCEGGGGSSKRLSRDSSSSGASDSRNGGAGAVDAGWASKGGGFERTIRNMSTVLESEVDFDLDAKKKQPSQDSKRASLERTKSAFIASEGESDLDARKKRLSQDSSNGDIGRSKSDVSRSNRPKPFSSSSDTNNRKSSDSSNRLKPLSSSSDGNNRNSSDSSNRLKSLSSSSDGNNKSSPGRSRNETSKKSLPLEKSIGSIHDSNGFDEDDDNAGDKDEDDAAAKKRSHRDGSRRRPLPAEKVEKRKYTRRATMERVTRAASSGMKLVRTSLDLSKSSRPSDDDEDDVMAKESRRRNNRSRDRPSKEKAIDRVTRAVRKFSLGDEEEKKTKKKRRSHDDDDDTDGQPIRRHASDGMIDPGGVKFNIYPSKYTREERIREERISGDINRRFAHRRRGTHTGSFLRRENSLLGGRPRRRTTKASASTEPMSLTSSGEAAAVTAVAVESTTSPGQTSSEMAENDKRSGQQRAASVSPQSKNRPRIKNRSRHCLCCATSILLLVVSAIAAYLVLQFLGKAPAMPSSPMTPQAATVNPAASSAETILATDLPSAAPSISSMDQQLINITTEQQTLNSTNEQQLFSNTAPTQSPLITSDVTIAIIVQLDGKPEETGFLLISADNLTTYISRPVGSLSNMQSEVVMEVVTIPKKTELVFTLEDASGDGLCCTHGDGYYRVFAGTGDQKTTIVSGEQGGKYIFTVGVQQAALQIDGVDPNENCKPCPTGKDCGRCAWCDAKEGFMSDTIFSYQCHSSAISIPKKCWIGQKRFQLHNQYVVAMAGCAEGLESWPQVETSNGTTLCVEEAKCIKSFPFVEPDCNQEFPGSLLVNESCQDIIGGIQFGYSWALNAPREKECASSSNFITSLASRCCVDSVAFCSTIDVDNADADEGQETIATPAPTPIDITTRSPTSSYAPTWDGHPLTVLIQLDDFPQETGFSITSVVNGENVTFLQRQEGYYTQSQQFVVENVQIPEGIDAVITLTDKEGDGFCESTYSFVARCYIMLFTHSLSP